SEKDFQIVHELSINQSAGQQTKEKKHLAAVLKKAKAVKDNMIGNDIVQPNSTVQVDDQATNRDMEFQVVLPSQANLKENKISILAPFGIALIGFKQDQLVEWQMPAGKRTLKIVKVENAPAMAKVK